MTILVTGFGPFDGGGNASLWLIEALERRRGALAELAARPVELAVLPVDTVAAPLALHRLLDRLRPSHVVLTGQAGGRAAVSLERLAVNRRAFSIPDEAGALIDDMPVVAGGPERLDASWWGIEDTAAAIRSAGVPCAVSTDCGTFLCNQMLYAVLHHAAIRELPIRAVFLHLPLTPGQVEAGEPAARRHPDCASLDVADAVRAVETLLQRTLLEPAPRRAAVTA